MRIPAVDRRYYGPFTGYRGKEKTGSQQLKILLFLQRRRSGNLLRSQQVKQHEKKRNSADDQQLKHWQYFVTDMIVSPFFDAFQRWPRCSAGKIPEVLFFIILSAANYDNRALLLLLQTATPNEGSSPGSSARL